jgi:hypothetical protein
MALGKEYKSKPQKNPPDETPSVSDLAAGDLRSDDKPIYAPYPNASSAALGEWFWAAHKKTLADLIRLRDVLCSPDFSIDDIRGTKWAVVHDQLRSDGDGKFFNESDAWRKVDLTIDVPIPRAEPQPFTVPGFHYRPLIPLLISVCKSDAAKTFQWTPFASIWQPKLGGPEFRLHDELMSSPAVLEEHERIQALPRDAGDTLERVVVPMLPASDGTHLTQFGNASVWPGYMGLGIQSKYARAQPSKHALHHFAYFQKVSFYELPSSLSHDSYAAACKHPGTHSETQQRQRRHQASSRALQARAVAQGLGPHARRRVHRGIRARRRCEVRRWDYATPVPAHLHLHRRLSGEVSLWLSASSVLTVCCRVLLCTIRDLGDRPCPCCLVRKEDIPQIGAPVDMARHQEQARVDDEERRELVEEARENIRQGYVVNSKPGVDDLLKHRSWVPVKVCLPRPVPSMRSTDTTVL